MSLCGYKNQNSTVSVSRWQQRRSFGDGLKKCIRNIDKSRDKYYGTSQQWGRKRTTIFGLYIGA